MKLEPTFDYRFSVNLYRLTANGSSTLFADKGQITANKVSLQTKLLSYFPCTIPYLLLWCDNAVGLALKAPPSHSLLSVMLMIGKFQVTLCKMLCSIFRPADKGSDTHDYYHGAGPMGVTSFVMATIQF